MLSDAPKMLSEKLRGISCNEHGYCKTKGIHKKHIDAWNLIFKNWELLFVKNSLLKPTGLIVDYILI